MQETFEIALSRHADYDATPGTLATRLQMLSRNVVRDHLQRHHRATYTKTKCSSLISIPSVTPIWVAEVSEVASSKLRSFCLSDE